MTFAMPRSRRHTSLWLRVLAGAVGGLLLSIALAGLYGWSSRDGMADRYMLLLWLFIPVWVAFFSLCIWCKQARIAWLLMIGLNVICWLGLYALQQAP